MITAALFARFYVARPGDYAARVLAALRNQFGGHAVKSRAERRAAAASPRCAHRKPAGRGPRAAAGPPDDADHLRRHRRPGQAQAAAGDLQPRPRGRAARALQPDRRLAPRHPARGIPRAWRATRSAVLAPRARRAGARRAARARALRRGHVRRRRRSTSAWTRQLQEFDRTPASRSTALFYLSTAPDVLPGDRRAARRARAQPATTTSTSAW